MRAFVASVVVAVVLAAGAAYWLEGSFQRSAYSAFSTGGARVAEPGQNLVGKSW
jgi:hypothetical protein